MNTYESSNVHKAREARLRRLADKFNLHLVKSRRYAPPNDYGDYALVDKRTNFAVWGWQFDLDLDDVEHLLTTE